MLYLPEGTDIGRAIGDAMKAVEEHSPDLKDALPKTYNRFENTTLREMLDTLKAQKLVLDWRKRQQSRAAVELTIQDLVWQLPKCYTDKLCQQKSADVYQHVYDSYYGAGQSVYAVVAG